MPERLWQKDPGIWSAEPYPPELADRLGWLDLPSTMQSVVDDLVAFGDEVRSAGIERVVLLGMGGSSLAPEVYQSVFGNADGYPALTVLDTTHPEAIRRVADSLNPTATLFIVSSKSGGTTETMSLFRYFWQMMSKATDTPQDHFVAVTDRGSSLDTLAREKEFRRIFNASPEVGGRYSALTEFGLVPAAAVGVDVATLLTGARDMAAACGSAVPPQNNPGLVLGAVMGEAALAGRDKLTIITSPALSALPAWIEQLIAESTGKGGKGIVPVVDEKVGAATAYGTDRLFVVVRVGDEEVSGDIDALEEAGHPVLRIAVADTSQLGGEFLRWEIATAMAGAVLDIHPFNQPDVQLAKDLSKRRMEDKESLQSTSWEDRNETITSDDSRGADELQRFLQSSARDDYVAIQAYLPPSDKTTDILRMFRMAIRDRRKVATTLGYGPRFLHSTGQLHKGGANNVRVIQIVDDAQPVVEIPGADATFGQLIRAQALGDAEALNERDRVLLRIVVGEDDLEQLLDWAGSVT